MMGRRCNCHDPSWRPGQVGIGHSRMCPQRDDWAPEGRITADGGRVVFDDGIEYQGVPSMDSTAYTPSGPERRPA